MHVQEEEMMHTKEEIDDQIFDLFTVIPRVEDVGRDEYITISKRILRRLPTMCLLAELSERMVVKEYWIEPHEKRAIEFDGPATVLEIID